MSFARSRRPVAGKLGLSPGVRLLVLGAELPNFGEPAADRVTHDADGVIVGYASVDDVAEYPRRRGRSAATAAACGWRTGRACEPSLEPTLARRWKHAVSA